MNFVPVKRCNPYLSRRIGDVVGYIPHMYYSEVLDAVFSGTVESWSDLPSNVQDVILQSENVRRISIGQESTIKKETLQRIENLKNQLNDLKIQLQTEKSVKIIERTELLSESKYILDKIKNSAEVYNV